MLDFNKIASQTKGWLDGSLSWDDLDANLQKAIDAIIAEEEDTLDLDQFEIEEEVTKEDPTSSDVHVDGVNWKTPKKKPKKTADEDITDLIHKANEEQKFTLGPWYIPNKGDAHNEWTDAEELQKALWDYVRSGDRDIRLQHNTDIVAGEWVEAMSFPVPVTLNMTKALGESKEVTYPAGTVFLGVKWNDWAWDMVKANKITGFSIGGSAARVEMGIPTDAAPMVNKNRFSTRGIAADYARRATEKAVVTDEHTQIKDVVRKLVHGEELNIAAAEPTDAMHQSIIIDDVKYRIVPLGKSYNDKVFNVAGLYGDNGAVAIVRTDGERFWASGSKALENLSFEKAQYAFAEVAKAKSFQGNRSAAGQYAANIRWGRKTQEAVNQTLGAGPIAAPQTDQGKAANALYDSLTGHCDFDALAADMAGVGLDPSKGDTPLYSMLRPHLSPERAALHDRIIEGHFVNEDGSPKTPPSGQPEYLFMGGGPAAGKSSMLERAQESGVAPAWAGNGTNKTGRNGSAGTDKHSVAVNADDIKAELPEYSALVGGASSPKGVGVAGRGGQKRAAHRVHEESSILSKEVSQRAQAKGLNVILDGTGDNNPKSMVKKIEDARSAKSADGKHNYKVTAIYATVPTSLAVQRAQNRGRPVGETYKNPDGTTGRGQGRFVPDSVVIGTHRGVSKVFPQVSDKFDSVSLFDTTARTPRLIARGTKGSALEVLDEKAYGDFLGKAE